MALEAWSYCRVLGGGGFGTPARGLVDWVADPPQDPPVQRFVAHEKRVFSKRSVARSQKYKRARNAVICTFSNLEKFQESFLQACRGWPAGLILTAVTTFPMEGGRGAS